MNQCPLTHRTDVIKLRNYGRILQDLVAYATTIKDERQRQSATIYIARCMRQKNQIWNKEFESGIQRLREDIEILSDGQLSTSFPGFEEAMAVHAQSDGQSPKRQNNQNRFARKQRTMR